MKRVIEVCVVAAAAVALLVGCASNRPSPTATPTDMERAQWGEDLPLGALEGELAFGEPSAEDALVLRDLNFAYDSSEINPEGKAILQGIAEWMMNKPQALLMAEGHCDERGTREYNTALGERRALSVRTALTALGVNPDRITTISYGKDAPLCRESNEECWGRNRRVHFKVDYGTGAPAAGAEPVVLEDYKAVTEEVVIYQEPVAAPRDQLLSAETESSAQPRERVMGRYHY